MIAANEFLALSNYLKETTGCAEVVYLTHDDSFCLRHNGGFHEIRGGSEVRMVFGAYKLGGLDEAYATAPKEPPKLTPNDITAFHASQKAKIMARQAVLDHATKKG